MIEIWSKKYLLSIGENLNDQLKCYKYFVAAKRKGLLGFKTKKDALQYIFLLNNKIILYFNEISQSWNIDEAQPYTKRRVVNKEYLPGGHNIFGEQLTGRVIDVIEEKIAYKCGEAIFSTKDLSLAHKFIKENNLIQVLNIH